ncbi:major capsid protein [Paenibacillus sp. L3-i20]|uniref:major capsid protein n=1 Tax=Paenibacillus sp. L3-i20 TaxID=2905833 RepID=UPI001EDD251F|nr:major capsid protein [Paenibacillus sp. L3-i20]GKU79296.1 hypothetical protein L3i20_v236930 [Paenibacillus sp. L3-i20]
MAGLAQYSDKFSNPLFTRFIQNVPVKVENIMGRFLPRVETFDTKFHESYVTRQADMANIVSALGDVPLTDRDPMRKVSGEIADIAQGYLVTKEELGALMDKSSDPTRRTLAETQLLGKTVQIKQNVDARIEWMGAQALTEGVLNYNKDGVILTTDFGVPSSNKKTAAIRWDDLNPTILADYEAWVALYKDLNGVTPAQYLTSTAVINRMLNDTLVRKQITGLSDKLITIAELNAFLTGRNMPGVEAWDGQVTYRDPNTGARTTARLLNPKKGVFLREGGEIGEQLIGPTIENEMRPGIFAETIDLKLPTRSVINVVASSFPKITNPNLIFQTTVLAQ